jgi:hypothetical protein
MTELSDEARALFDAARSAHEPNGRDRERVRQSVLVRVGAIAAGSSLTRAGLGATSGTSTAAMWAGKGIATKVVLGLALIGSAGTGAYYVAHSPKESSPAPRLELRAKREAPPVALERNTTVPPAPSPPSEPAIPSRSHRPAVLDHATTIASKDVPSNTGPSPAVSAFPDVPSVADTAPTAALPTIAPSSALTLEAQGLSAVERALRNGRAAEALALLDQQERTFRGGKLDLERQAARIIALCAVGRQAEARAFAARFLARAPSSFLAARVRNTCAGQ